MKVANLSIWQFTGLLIAVFLIIGFLFQAKGTNPQNPIAQNQTGQQQPSRQYPSRQNDSRNNLPTSSGGGGSRGNTRVDNNGRTYYGPRR